MAAMAENTAVQVNCRSRQLGLCGWWNADTATSGIGITPVIFEQITPVMCSISLGRRRLKPASSPLLSNHSAVGLTDLAIQPCRAASILATSIFFIVIIASNARLATARSGSVIAAVRARGVICQFRPHLSLHQPHALS
jgi:hypothetical protein